MYLGIPARFLELSGGLEDLGILAASGAVLCALYGVPTGLVLARVIRRAPRQGDESAPQVEESRPGTGEDLRQDSRARQFLRGLAVLISALAGGGIAGLFTLPLGLVIIEHLLWPLTLGISALLSALCAFWANNLFTRGGRGRLLPIVGVALIAATIVAVVVLVLPVIGGRDFFFALYLPPIFVLLIAMLVITPVTSLATWLLRAPESGTDREAERDIQVTAMLLTLAVICTIGALVLSTVLTGGRV